MGKPENTQLLRLMMMAAPLLKHLLLRADRLLLSSLCLRTAILHCKYAIVIQVFPVMIARKVTGVAGLFLAAAEASIWL